MYEILLILLGYLYGSIPFALVIGKVFYNTDVRESGSGNLGGTNAGRVLGKKAGISVIVLDALKAVIIFYLSSYLSLKFNLNPDIKYLAGLACIFGHCYILQYDQIPPPHHANASSDKQYAPSHSLHK